MGLSCVRIKRTTAVLAFLGILSLFVLYARAFGWYKDELAITQIGISQRETIQTKSVAPPDLPSYDRQTIKLQRILPNEQLEIGNRCDVVCNEESRAIFFLETNPEVTVLSGRKLCAFESAARANPDRQVVLVKHTNHSPSPKSLQAIEDMDLPNFCVLETDFVSLVESVPTVARHFHNLSLYERPSLEKSVQASDLVRYALLFNCGGTYMDSDTVSISALPDENEAPNFVVEDVAAGYLNGAFMRFERDNQFLKHIIGYLATYKGTSRNSYGPDLLRMVARKACPHKDKGGGNSKFKWRCKDFFMLHKKYANAWDSKDWGGADQGSNVDRDKLLRGIQDSFAVHYFGGAFDEGRVNLTKHSPLYEVMTNNCPKAMLWLEQEVSS